MGAPDWVDVFPIKNWDVIPASYVSLPEGIYINSPIMDLGGASHRIVAPDLLQEKTPKDRGH